MPSLKKSNAAVLSATQGELEFWKKKSQQLEKELKELKYPVRKVKVERDPFKLLPPHCHEIIFKQLSETDILNMTKVSMYWKLTINKDKTAFKKLFQALLLKRETVCDHVKFIRSDVAIKYANFLFEPVDFSYMSKFSKSLEVIKMEQKEKDRTTFISPFGAMFLPRLYKLKITLYNFKFLDWFRHCYFFALTDLRLNYKINCESLSPDSYNAAIDLTQRNDKHGGVFRQMRKLTHFSIWNNDFVLYDNRGRDLVSERERHLPHFHMDILLICAETLTSLEIRKMHLQFFQFIMYYMKNLKKFAVQEVFVGKHPLEPRCLKPNDTIVSLKCGKIWKYFNDFTKVLKSLEEVTIDDELTSSAFLSFANKNKNLKKVTCKSVESNLMEDFQKARTAIRGKDRLNSTIEIVVDKNIKYSSEV